MSGFHGAFAMNVVCQQGTLTLPDIPYIKFLLKPFNTSASEQLNVVTIHFTEIKHGGQVLS